MKIIVLTLFGVLTLNMMGLACPNHSATECALELEHNVKTLTQDVTESAHMVNISLIQRDNTNVVMKRGLFGFFASALKSVAVWGGVKLTKWVLGKINRRASTYSYYYQERDPGVVKAANHWDNLMRRTPCNGSEPSGHSVGTCPICSKQLADLQSRR